MGVPLMQVFVMVLQISAPSQAKPFWHSELWVHARTSDAKSVKARRAKVRQ
jgi:hypothetical protein